MALPEHENVTDRSPSEDTVRIASPDERQALADTLVLAFIEDPINRWLFPDPAVYLEAFPEFVRSYGGKAFDHESAYVTDNLAATALWLPSGVYPDESAIVEVFTTHVPPERQKPALEALETLDRYHPDEPCWQLPFIGTEPTRQGQGSGSVLMEYALDRCDRNGELAYLESTNPQNLSLYLRHGFEILGTVRVGSMPPLFPMKREPQRRPTSL